MYSNHFQNSVDCNALCQSLLTTIHSEADICTTTNVIEVVLPVLPNCGNLLTKVPTRGKPKTPIKSFDLNNYMNNNNNYQEHLETFGNGDCPRLLLLNINRYQNFDGNMNSQPIQFSDTITVPTTEEVQMQYKLTGYVLFTGNTEGGHYKVIVRGNDNRWFLYDDENVRELNVKQRGYDGYKCEVVLLLYAENSYYDNTSMENDGSV